jgi:hypothetical protein
MSCQRKNNQRKTSAVSKSSFFSHQIMQIKHCSIFGLNVSIAKFQKVNKNRLAILSRIKTHMLWHLNNRFQAPPPLHGKTGLENVLVMPKSAATIGTVK